MNNPSQNYSVLMSIYAKVKACELIRSINSMLQQTVPPSEIVIVKDGVVSGEVLEVLDGYGKEYGGLFKVIGYEQGRGLWYALDYGIQACSFDLIARMDSDDYSLPERIEKELDAFEVDPSLDCVGTRVVEFEGDIENPVSLVELPSEHDDILRFGRLRCPYRHPTLLYRKEAVIAAGGYQEMPFFEDFDLFLRMAKNGARFRNIEAPLVYMGTDSDFFRRRGEFSYLKKMIHFRSCCLKRGDISVSEFARAAIPHAIVTIVPNAIRAMFYKKLLRKRV